MEFNAVIQGFENQTKVDLCSECVAEGSMSTGKQSLTVASQVYRMVKRFSGTSSAFIRQGIE